jgi:Domain of unknown function (DUF4388)/Tetratricopeptide repeat
MPIEGPIRDLALSDLLQLLFLSRRTGRLVISSGSSEVVLRLREGAITGATGGAPELRLGRLLVQSGRATEGQIRLALERQRRGPPHPLGEILVDAGVVRQAEVERQLRFQIEETVFDLMRLEEGHLHFEESGRPPRQRIEVEIGTDAVLMNSARRLDEFAEVLPDSVAGDPLPRLAVPVGAAAPSPLQLQTLEWEVLAAVDGESTLRQIARSLGRGELEVARAVYGLAAAGVVEVGSRSGNGGAGDRGGASLRGEIDRAIREGRRELAEELLGAITSRNEAETPGAEAHLLEGRVRALGQDWDGARAAFEEAVRIDPLLAEGYFHLARAAIRAGHLPRAESALRVYQRLNDPAGARREAAARMARSLEELRKSTSDAEP